MPVESLTREIFMQISAAKTVGAPNQGLHCYSRRGLEYAFTIGIALLCSYWIMQGRW